MTTDWSRAIAAVRSAGYTEAAARLRRELKRTPDMTTTEAIELLEREAGQAPPR